MLNRNELTPEQMSYLQLLVAKTRPLTALEYAMFLKLLDLESLNRFIALCEQRKKEKQKRVQRIEKIMQEIRQQAIQRRQKRKQAPKRSTIAQAWEKRRLERLRVKKKLPLVCEIDTTCITGSNSTNRQSPVMSEQVKYDLMQYYRNQN